MSVQDEERYIDERERENRICKRARERESRICEPNGINEYLAFNDLSAIANSLDAMHMNLFE